MNLATLRDADLAFPSGSPSHMARRDAASNAPDATASRACANGNIREPAMTGRKPPRNLDKKVSFCFDRFDLSITFAGMSEFTTTERELWKVRAHRWWSRAHYFALLRDTLRAA